MNDFIVGNDISSYQGQIDWGKYKDNTNFVLIQSSYGNGYFDSWYGYNKAQVQKTNVLHGYYHYAYPEYNSPEDEARWFINALSAVNPLQAGEVLALDFEEQYSGDKVDWAKRFLDYISNHFNGIKPLFYSYQSLVEGSDFTPLVQAGYALWIAAPTGDPQNNNFQTGKWPDAVMQQWGGQNNVPGINATVDADIFFGKAEQFAAYGYKPVVQSPATPTTPPPNVVVTQPVPAPDKPTPPVVIPAPQPIPSTPTPPTNPPTPPTDTPSQPVVKSWLQVILDFLLGLFTQKGA